MKLKMYLNFGNFFENVCVSMWPIDFTFYIFIKYSRQLSICLSNCLKKIDYYSYTNNNNKLAYLIFYLNFNYTNQWPV